MYNRKNRRQPKTRDDVVAHFQKRCAERLGIILNQRVLKTLMADGKLRTIRRQSNTRTHFLLKKEKYNGEKLLQFDVELVYDKPRHAFVTLWKFGSEKPADS